MKKLYYLIVLTLILGLVLTGCTLLSNVGQVPTTEQSGITYLTKHTEGAPFVTDLIAGGGNPASEIDVGDVLVWNDGDTLYVKYFITDPDWCLTETHLHVADELILIPQTKTGNPKPGQFEENDEHDCVTEVLYTYNLKDRGWSVDDDLFVAAHAVVVNIEETITTEVDLKWGRSLEDPEYICSSSNYGEPLTITCGFALPIDEDQAVWDQTTWAYWTQYPIDNVNTYKYQVRHFQALFELPKEIKPDNVEDLILFNPDYLVDDIIPINDNIYVYLNNNKIGHKGVCYSDATLNWMISPEVGWYVSGSFSADGPKNLNVGSNIIDIVAEEACGWGGMGELGLKLIWHPEETAWGAGFGFPGANWATYCEYTVQGWDLTGIYVWRFLYTGSPAGTILPIPYDHDMDVTIHYWDTTGDFEGVGGYPAGGPYSVTWEMEGNVDGDDVEFYIDYDGSNYYIEATGTIAPDGSMSGTCETPQGSPYNWLTISGFATRRPQI